MTEQHHKNEAPHLRLFRPEDQPGFFGLVTDMHRSFGFAFDPDLDADLADPLLFYRQVWTLMLDGAVVGSVALTPPSQGTTTLKRMYLRPRLRGQGWGRSLLETAVDAARAWSCQRIRLDTSERQQAAHRLYEAAGFRLQSVRDDTRHYEKPL